MGHGTSAVKLVPPSLGVLHLLGDLRLSLSTQHISDKPVNCIRTDQFVEMHDLVSDNIAITQHFETVSIAFPAQLVLPASSHPLLCEVTLSITCTMQKFLDLLYLQTYTLYKFVAALYMFSDVLSPLASLSCAFQKKDIDFM